jgi:hypothetical protein
LNIYNRTIGRQAGLKITSDVKFSTRFTSALEKILKRLDICYDYHDEFAL